MNANSDREYIDNKVGDVRAAVDAQFQAVHTKIESTVAAAKAELIKWIAGSLIAIISMFVGMAGLMISLLSHQPPAIQAPAAPPSIVIQFTPQGAAVAPAVPPADKP